eukprot:5227453-Pleurochrysis_carterae.AAC.2
MPKQALAVAHGVPVDEQYVPMGCAVSVTPAAASQPASQPTHVHVVVEQRGRQAASDAFFAAQTRVEARRRRARARTSARPRASGAAALAAGRASHAETRCIDAHTATTHSVRTDRALAEQALPTARLGGVLRTAAAGRSVACCELAASTCRGNLRTALPSTHRQMFGAPTVVSPGIAVSAQKAAFQALFATSKYGAIGKRDC